MQMTQFQQDLRHRFLEPEVRCGYMITHEQKLLWKTLLEILEVVIGVCECYGLRYWVEAGSMLGAVRHGGIIPWDDDVDIAMPRRDYELLQKILPAKLPSHMSMQTSAYEFEYTISHVKVRDKRTSAIVLGEAKAHRRYNMGVFLDVFPVDGVPESESVRKKILCRLNWFRHLYYLSLPHDTSTFKRKIGAIVGFLAKLILGRRLFFRLRERIYSNDFDGVKIVQMAIGEWGFLPRFSRKREWLDDFIELPFEYLNVRVPRAYDEILTQTYGDWHRLVHGGGLHSGIAFDLRRDYKTVLREEYGYRQEDFL